MFESGRPRDTPGAATKGDPIADAMRQDMEVLSNTARQAIQLRIGMMQHIGEASNRAVQSSARALADAQRQAAHDAVQGFKAVFELQQQFIQVYVDAMTRGAATLASAAQHVSAPVPPPPTEHSELSPQAMPAAPQTSEQTRILVVEDDADVGRVTAAFLSKAGFAVTTAGSGDEALVKLVNDPVFKALVTDYAMPGMTGVDLILQAREMHPGLSALVITGYAGAEGLNRLPFNVKVLHKPFQRKDLVRDVMDLVESATPAKQP